MVKFGLISDDDDDDHHPNSNSNSSGSSSTPRHFFIPFVTNLSTPTSNTQPFCIPKAFMKYLQVGKKKLKKKSHEKRGREVLEAILRSNGRGKSFHVNMIMGKDGRLMSDDEHEHHDQQVEEDVQQARGWKDFCDYHDLHMGDFLLFRHIGSLSFDVIVFDSTTCQRKYPPLDPPFFFFDHATTGKNFKTTTPDRAKRADADNYNDDVTPSNQFVTSLKHYNFSQWMMTIPRGFARSNGLGNKTCTITFRDEKGRSWPIDLRHKKTRDQAYVRGGWREFIEGNGLKAGDVCTFELVSRRGGTKNIVFDVRIGSMTTTTPGQAKQADDAVSAGSYSTDDAASAGSYSTDDATSAGGSTDDDDTPSNQFTTTLKHYNFSQWMMKNFVPNNKFGAELYNFSQWVQYFPVKFVRCNGLGNKTCMITFRDEIGRSWPIGLRYKKSSGDVYIYCGWRQFIKGNGLKEGDVCTFELVSLRGTKNIIFDVHRGSKTTTPGQAKHAGVDGAAAAGSPKENTPSNKFTTRLKHYSFSKWTMTIPAEFVRSNGLRKKNCTITFRDEKGRSWPINLRNYNSGEAKVSGGWRQFIKGNGFEEGDVCTFELVSRRGGTKNIVFDVYRGSKGTAPDQAMQADVETSAGSYNDDDKPPNQFTTPLKHYNFSQWIMHFPMEFVRSNGLGNKSCTITFRDEKRRSWPIGLRCKKSSGQVYVRGGWRQFIRRNGLKEGNVCTFELVSRRGGTNNIVFEVRRGHH